MIRFVFDESQHLLEYMSFLGFWRLHFLRAPIRQFARKVDRAGR